MAMVAKQNGRVGRKRQPQTPEIRRSLAGKLGARIAALADAAGIDADTLASKIGKTGDTVRLYYSGRVVPPLNDWPKIAKALGLSEVRELLP
jgi:ribosome-binding protein aMBF1 (putative translation factor)